MMQCHALSTMERLAGVILGVGFMDLDSDTRMKILDLLDDCGVLKMSAVDTESRGLLESRKQEIFDKVEVAMWLRDGENRDLEIQDDAGAVYKIHTERKAIHKIPCWGLSISPPGGGKRREGTLFYRSGEWILNFLNRYKDLGKRQWRVTIYRFHKLDEFKQILKSQPKSAEYYTISDDGSWDDSEFVVDSDTDPTDLSLKQWLLGDERRGLDMNRIKFLKQKGCNWEFRLKIDPFVLSDRPWPQYLRGYIVFNPNSKIDVWYELALDLNREHWILNGYIQDINEDELKSIYKRQPAEWVNADEPLYSAWNLDDPKSEWRPR